MKAPMLERRVFPTFEEVRGRAGAVNLRPRRVAYVHEERDQRGLFTRL